MKCPVCAALNREHNDECKAEALATLKLRADLIGWHHDDTSTQGKLDEEVLRSRKRQAHIAFELHEHQTSAHPVPDNAKAASA